jgi:hypothetical protein
MRETQVPMAGISDAKTNPPGCYDFVIAQLCHSNQHNAYADDKPLVISPLSARMGLLTSRHWPHGKSHPDHIAQTLFQLPKKSTGS